MITVLTVYINYNNNSSSNKEASNSEEVAVHGAELELVLAAEDSETCARQLFNIIISITMSMITHIGMIVSITAIIIIVIITIIIIIIIIIITIISSSTTSTIIDHYC